MPFLTRWLSNFKIANPSLHCRFDQALYGGVASGEPFLRQFNHPSPTMTGHTAAIYDVGCLLGALCAAAAAARLGHKKTIVSLNHFVYGQH